MSKKSKQPEQNVEVKQEQIQEQIVEEPKKVEIPEQKFPTELLVKSEKLAQFRLHRDVIRAILTKQEYTLSDAISAIKKYIDSFNV